MRDEKHTYRISVPGSGLSIRTALPMGSNEGGRSSPTLGQWSLECQIGIIKDVGLRGGTTTGDALFSGLVLFLGAVKRSVGYIRGEPGVGKKLAIHMLLHRANLSTKGFGLTREMASKASWVFAVPIRFCVGPAFCEVMG